MADQRDFELREFAKNFEDIVTRSVESLILGNANLHVEQILSADLADLTYLLASPTLLSQETKTLFVHRLGVYLLTSRRAVLADAFMKNENTIFMLRQFLLREITQRPATYHTVFRSHLHQVHEYILFSEMDSLMVFPELLLFPEFVIFLLTEFDNEFPDERDARTIREHVEPKLPTWKSMVELATSGTSVEKKTFKEKEAYVFENRQISQIVSIVFLRVLGASSNHREFRRTTCLLRPLLVGGFPVNSETFNEVFYNVDNYLHNAVLSQEVAAEVLEPYGYYSDFVRGRVSTELFGETATSRVCTYSLLAAFNVGQTWKAADMEKYEGVTSNVISYFNNNTAATEAYINSLIVQVFDCLKGKRADPQCSRIVIEYMLGELPPMAGGYVFIGAKMHYDGVRRAWVESMKQRKKPTALVCQDETPVSSLDKILSVIHKPRL